MIRQKIQKFSCTTNRDNNTKFNVTRKNSTKKNGPAYQTVGVINGQRNKQNVNYGKDRHVQSKVEKGR